MGVVFVGIDGLNRQTDDTDMLLNYRCSADFQGEID